MRVAYCLHRLHWIHLYNGVGYEPSGIVPGEPRDPLSSQKSTFRSSRIPIYYQLRCSLKPERDGIHTTLELKEGIREERDGFMPMQLEESSTIESHFKVASTTRRHIKKKILMTACNVSSRTRQLSVYIQRRCSSDQSGQHRPFCLSRQPSRPHSYPPRLSDSSCSTDRSIPSSPRPQSTARIR